MASKLSRTRSVAGMLLLASCSVANPGVDPAESAPHPFDEASAQPDDGDGGAASTSLAAPASATPSPPVAAPASPCPADMVLVGRVCIDRYEAYLVETGLGGADQVHPYYERPVRGATYAAANAVGVYPQAYISRVEAQSACVGSGKRLCSRTEWQAACRGTAVRTMRRTPASVGSPCNIGKQHLLAQMFGMRVSYRYEEDFNSPELDKAQGFLARSGEYAGCTSDMGVHDMVGNLHEWVSDPVTAGLLAALESDGVRRQWQPGAPGNGVFMGGFYSTTSEHGPGCQFTTVAHEPAYHDYSTGFRCCRPSDG